MAQFKLGYANWPHRSPDKCDGLPEGRNLQTNTSLPVQYGTEVTVYCQKGYEMGGDTSITCIKGTEFTAKQLPLCTIGTMQATFHFFFNRFS